MTHTVGQYQPNLARDLAASNASSLRKQFRISKNLSDKEFAAKLKTKSQATGLQSISQ